MAFSTEARRAPRCEYPYRQRYAPFREGRWPSDEEFRPAELHDISLEGVSLLLNQRPTSERLVVELGVGENVSQRLAQVVRVTPVIVAGEQVYQVGCAFLVESRAR